MFRMILLGFMLFSTLQVTLPSQCYAISLDDDEEDAEDVADLLEEAKRAGRNESFSKADELLKKAKMYGVSGSDVQETEHYVAQKKRAREARLERECKERERLARLKREREERVRRASVAKSAASGNAHSSNTSNSGSSVYKCKFHCEGQFGAKRGGDKTASVTAGSMMNAEQHVKEQYKDVCDMYPFYKSGRGATVGTVFCEKVY